MWVRRTSQEIGSIEARKRRARYNPIGPLVIAAYTFDNEDQRWTGDNEGKITLAKIGEAIVKAWSPTGLDPAVIDWANPLAPAGH